MIIAMASLLGQVFLFNVTARFVVYICTLPYNVILSYHLDADSRCKSLASLIFVRPGRVSLKGRRCIHLSVNNHESHSIDRSDPETKAFLMVSGNGSLLEAHC